MPCPPGGTLRVSMKELGTSLTWIRAGMRVRLAGQPCPFVPSKEEMGRDTAGDNHLFLHCPTHSLTSHSPLPLFRYSFSYPLIHSFIHSIFTKHLLCPGALARAPGGGPASLTGTVYHLGYLEVCVSNKCSCSPPRSCHCPKFTARNRPNRALDLSAPLPVSTPSGTLMHL